MKRAAFVAALFVLPGCAGAAYAGSYGVVGAACIAQERIIIARDGSSFERDSEDIALVRTVCDAILERIENEAAQ